MIPPKPGSFTVGEVSPVKSTESMKHSPDSPVRWSVKKNVPALPAMRLA